MAKLQMHAHNMVASVAVNAAYELYETLMGDNVMYDAWKRKHPGKSAKALALLFVRDNVERCIPIARATLAGLLTSPTLSEEHKESIVEALALDATLMKGRAQPAQIIGSHHREG